MVHNFLRNLYQALVGSLILRVAQCFFFVFYGVRDYCLYAGLFGWQTGDYYFIGVRYYFHVVTDFKALFL